MTLVSISKDEFTALDDERLGWACAGPTLVSLRGKDMGIKGEAMAALNEHQRSLCLFRVLYDHAKDSAPEYYGWICYLLERGDYWSGVLGALRFFEVQSMQELLNETRNTLEEYNRRLGRTWNQVSITDLDRDEELRNKVVLWYDRFMNVSKESLRTIARHIRAHPDAFVVFDG
ncbi:DMP19 family protein [Paenibacillus gansuensis]|uniref:DUF4375 domain-containing protein n=1 Tax=Paenibacillus gansuensis TaxID=306542 RepID=A0ABW5PIE4_9BACL